MIIKLVHRNFTAHQATLCVCHLPKYLFFLVRLLVYRHLLRAVYHYTSNLHIDAHLTKCKLHNRVFGHLDIHRHIYVRPSKCKFHCHACYFLSNLLHISCRLAIHNSLYHLFYFHTIIRRMCFHHSRHKDHDRVSCLLCIHLRI